LEVYGGIINDIRRIDIRPPPPNPTNTQAKKQKGMERLSLE
jgi:hypothetical protein